MPLTFADLGQPRIIRRTGGSPETKKISRISGSAWAVRITVFVQKWVDIVHLHGNICKVCCPVQTQTAFRKDVSAVKKARILTAVLLLAVLLLGACSGPGTLPDEPYAAVPYQLFPAPEGAYVGDTMPSIRRSVSASTATWPTSSPRRPRRTWNTDSR